MVILFYLWVKQDNKSYNQMNKDMKIALPVYSVRIISMLL